MYPSDECTIQFDPGRIPSGSHPASRLSTAPALIVWPEPDLSAQLQTDPFHQFISLPTALKHQDPRREAKHWVCKYTIYSSLSWETKVIPSVPGAVLRFLAAGSPWAASSRSAVAADGACDGSAPGFLASLARCWAALRLSRLALFLLVLSSAAALRAACSAANSFCSLVCRHNPPGQYTSLILCGLQQQDA